LIKLFSPNITSEGETASMVIKSGNWASGSGNNIVRAFEYELGKYLGCKHVVAVNSGTAALHLALSMFDIKGKEVILPALSFVSTANAVLYNGGIPVFADVREDTLCLDFDNLPLTDKTACILPVHFGGMKCKRPFSPYPIVEDSAHRIERNSVVNISCYSFHPVKNLAMPTGGAIALPDVPNDASGEIKKLKAKKVVWYY